MFEEDASLFSQVVALGSGKSVVVVKGMERRIELLRMADRYHVDAIQTDHRRCGRGLDDSANSKSELKLEICMRILTTACVSALARLERANRKLALRELDQYAECAGFMDVSEEVLRSLLDDDALVSESEYRRGAHSAVPGCIPCI
jgi:hypothetical protein